MNSSDLVADQHNYSYFYYSYTYTFKVESLQLIKYGIECLLKSMYETIETIHLHMYLYMYTIPIDLMSRYQNTLFIVSWFMDSYYR